MGTATWVKDTSNVRANAALYRFDPPLVSSGWDDAPGHDVPYAVVSAASPSGDPETYVFEADEAGQIVDWSEMECSQRGTLSHEDVLQDAGYEIVREAE